MNAQQYCEYCGSALEPDWQFCENCGNRITVSPPAPIVNPSATQSKQQARPPAPHRKKVFPSWLILLVGAGCLGLVCVGILAIGGYLYLQSQPEIAIVPTEAVQNPPMQTQIPPAELPPTKQAQPVGEIGSPQETFSRWPLDYSLQWELGENDIFITDINQDQSWIISLKKSESIVMAIPPDSSAYYPASVNIHVKIKPGDFATAGPYGVMCNFQDENNYYVAEIWGSLYGIGKMENGVFTPLTEPYWQTSQFIDQIGPDGFVEVGVSCFSYSVGLEINGLGETFPVSDTAESFSSGAVALFGSSSQEAMDMLMGIFYFKDLVIEPMD